MTYGDLLKQLLTITPEQLKQKVKCLIESDLEEFNLLEVALIEDRITLMVE